MVRYRSWSTLFLIAITLLATLLWVRTGYISMPVSAVPPKAKGTPVQTRKPTAVTRLGPRNAYNAISERPLFAQTRRPPEAEAAADVPKTQTNLPNLRLRGTVLSTEGTYCLIQKLPSKETLRMMEGQIIEGWRIEKILPDRVILKSGDKTEEIELWNEQINSPNPPAKPSPRRPRLKLPSPKNRM